MLKVFLFLFGGFHLFPAFGQFSEQRKFQLDSITSTIPVSVRKDLSAVHHLLDSLGTNDEEKVWLFYGYIGTYFKYDYKRKKDFKAAEYSPEYATQLSSGVCRDFSKVFLVLCQRSNIPCLEIGGKCPSGFFSKINSILHRNSLKANHRWNVVKINGSWRLMDPTWTTVVKTTKIKTFQPKSKSYKTTIVKSVNREYYDALPEKMKLNHAPIHPAFYLSTVIPSYKTVFKKSKKQKIYAENYSFANTLDSIFKQSFPEFSRIFIKESVNYSAVSTLYSSFRYETQLPLLKTSRFNKPSIESYSRNIAHLKKLNDYILRENNINFEVELNECIKKINQKITRLENAKIR